MTVLMIMNCPSPDRTPTLNRLADEGLEFEVIYVAAGGEEHGWGALDLQHPHTVSTSPTRAAQAVSRRLLEGDVDVVVAHGYRALPYAVALTISRLRGIQVILRSDSNIDAALSEPPAKRLLRRAVGRLLIPRGALAWTVGSKNAEFWRREFGVSRQEAIPFETPRLPGGRAPRDRHRELGSTLGLLYVGRIVEVKRVADLIEATRLIGDSISWRLTIVGKGPELGRLTALACDDPRIHFVGPATHDEVGAYMSEADVLVLPSGYEPWGLVVNEALGFGVRVLASDAVGAAADLITPENGAVFPVGDVARLAAELMRSAHVTFQACRPPAQDTSMLMRASIEEVRLGLGEPRAADRASSPAASQ